MQHLGRTHRHVGGGELGERAVAQELDDPAAVAVHDLARDPLEAVHEPHGLALVLLGQPRVADDVGEPHRGEMMRERHPSLRERGMAEPDSVRRK